MVNWRLVNRLFWAALTVRMLVMAMLSETSNDEGLWLWNARCAHWHLPAHGMMHQALSPATYWVFRSLFQVTGPSLLAARMLHACLISVSLWTLMRFWKTLHADMAMFIVLWFLAVDPYGFRAWSWSLIEPQLMACLIGVYLVLNGRQDSRQALRLGALIGVCLSIKLTGLWLLALLCPRQASVSAFKTSAMGAAAALLVTGSLYGSIYLLSDQERFREMWHLHASGRFAPFTGILTSLETRDLRPLFYLAVIGIYPLALWAVCHRQRLGTAETLWTGLAILAGFAYLMLQSDLPARYMIPVAMLALMEAARLWSASGLYFPRWVVTGALVAAFAANVWYFRDTVMHARNAGGKFVQGISSLAASLHLRQSVPPSECIHVNADIPPASAWYLAVRPEHEVFPDLWVQHGASAGPSPGDATIREEIARRGLQPALKLELYDVYTSDPRLLDALKQPMSPWQICR